MRPFGTHRAVVHSRPPARLRVFALTAALAAPLALRAQQPADTTSPITLEQALTEARTANAQLPVARLEVQGAVARVQQARGMLYPTLAADGDVHLGTPQSYASSDALVRILAQAPIYQGGELRAGLAQSHAEADALRAGYRMAVRDVDFAVRVGYGRVLRDEAEIAFRQRAIQRLDAYLTVIQGRQAAGQGVGADLLKTQQRVASAQADIAALQRDLDEARMELNDVLGRSPDAPLRLAPLPEPSPPADTTGQPWLVTPDVAQSQAQVRAAVAGVQAAHAGRKPHIALEADAGGQPVLGSDVALLNNGTGWGAQLLVSVTLPFWDAGIYHGRVAEAGAALDQANQQEVAVRRAAHLAWSQAVADLANLYLEYQARTRAAGIAQDAYLQAESLYRGGQGTALDVLDAYDAWIQADQSQLDALFGYRAANATLIRWGES